MNLQTKFKTKVEATHLKPEVSEYEKKIAAMWLDGMYERLYGESAEEQRARITREVHEAAEQAMEQAVEEAVKQAVEQAVKQAAEQAAKQAAEQAAKQAAEQAAKRAAEQAAKQAAEQAAKQAAEQAAKQIESVVKNMLTNTDLSVQQIAGILNITEQKVVDIQAKIKGK